MAIPPPADVWSACCTLAAHSRGPLGSRPPARGGGSRVVALGRKRFHPLFPHRKVSGRPCRTSLGLLRARLPVGLFGGAIQCSIRALYIGSVPPDLSCPINQTGYPSAVFLSLSFQDSAITVMPSSSRLDCAYGQACRYAINTAVLSEPDRAVSPGEVLPVPPLARNQMVFPTFDAPTRRHESIRHPQACSPCQ